MSAPYIADRGPVSIRVYRTDQRPDLVATIPARAGTDDDTLLREHGWRRISRWSQSDEMPGDHSVATLERATGRDALDRLERDQQAGRVRRANGTP